MSDIDGSVKHFGVYEGTVTAVDQRHRVQANIPGLCSTSAWCRPRTLAGGAGRGGGMCPQVGDPVYVQFLGGDIDSPIYEGGSWTDGSDPTSLFPVPKDMASAAGDAAQVSVIEWSRGTTHFRFLVDERTGHRTFRLQVVEVATDKTETIIGSIELDVEQRVIDVYAMAGVQLRSLGFVDLKGLAVRALGRRVRRTAAPI